MLQQIRTLQCSVENMLSNAWMAAAGSCGAHDLAFDQVDTLRKVRARVTTYQEAQCPLLQPRSGSSDGRGLYLHSMMMMFVVAAARRARLVPLHKAARRSCCVSGALQAGCTLLGELTRGLWCGRAICMPRLWLRVQRRSYAGDSSLNCSICSRGCLPRLHMFFRSACQGLDGTLLVMTLSSKHRARSSQSG